MNTPITRRLLTGRVPGSRRTGRCAFMWLRTCYHLAAREQTGPLAVLLFGGRAGAV